ncbi:MAG: glycogen/starch synthase [Flavobacteriales bacterium]
MDVKKRVLFVSQEISPYLPESDLSNLGRTLPQGIMERGKDIRIFMPKFGCINERRNQLHEVIRLSGMNMILDNLDYPLIIKVASLQPVRMQVYFIENEDYFPKKTFMHELDGEFFEFHDERVIFFCRGVLETVKKLGWAPDVVHCNGWMTSLLPMYLKKAFADDPIFADTKIVYSVYDQEIEGELSNDMARKTIVNGVEKEDISVIEEATINNLHRLAIDFADAVIIGSEKIDPEIEQYIIESGKSSLQYHDEEDCVEVFDSLYDELLEQEPILT